VFVFRGYLSRVEKHSINENCSLYFHLQPVFIIHAKTANSLCDKVKPITSGDLKLPTLHFTARPIIENGKQDLF